jgi:hypothetical protein
MDAPPGALSSRQDESTLSEPQTVPNEPDTRGHSATALKKLEAQSAHRFRRAFSIKRDSQSADTRCKAQWIQIF